jgi:hypothetical protein
MTTDPLSRARALLEAATPGEWIYNPRDPLAVFQHDGGHGGMGDSIVCHSADDARLIAAAPALLAALCDELEKAREVVEAAREARGPRHRLPHQWMCACSACADDRAADAALPSALARYDAARRGEAG